jgi:single-strand DNA-binding protein
VASNLNTFAVEGRLTADPELRQVNGQAVLELRIAIGRSYRTENGWQDAASFVGVTIWAGRAAHVARVARKGDLLTFSGEIRSSEWVDKETGTNRSRVYLLASHVSGEALFRKAEEMAPATPNPDPVAA